MLNFLSPFYILKNQGVIFLSWFQVLLCFSCYVYVFLASSFILPSRSFPYSLYSCGAHNFSYFILLQYPHSTLETYREDELRSLATCYSVHRFVVIQLQLWRGNSIRILRALCHHPYCISGCLLRLGIWSNFNRN